MFARSFATLTALALGLISSHQFAGFDAPDSSQARWAEQCEAWDEWDKAGPPFRIYGNTWYVGTCGISAILITSDTGHVLIDAGTASGAELIAENISAVGFDIRDVRIILVSHEHDDHVGGLARLQELSGAVVLSSRRARASLETGRASEGDPQNGIANSYAPVKVAGIAEDNMQVRFGELKILGLETPGHTPGAMSWQWQATTSTGKVPMTVNYIDSLSPISAEDYRFSDHPDYVAEFRHGLERLKHVGCGILLTPHPSASRMHKRIVAGGLTEDRSACSDYAAAIEKRLEARLAKEAEVADDQ